jgi:hypothetical protein
MALLLGVLGGIAYAVAKLLSAEDGPDGYAAPAAEPWPRLTTDPVAPSAPPPVAEAWVEPAGGACPTSHPVKAKLASKIFHLPGMANYDRTNPDRCYVDAAAAEADGLRASKR